VADGQLRVTGGHSKSSALLQVGRILSTIHLRFSSVPSCLLAKVAYRASFWRAETNLLILRTNKSKLTPSYSMLTRHSDIDFLLHPVP